jgi:hypothetical protein
MINIVNVRGLKKEKRLGIIYCGRSFAGWPAHPLANPFRPRTYTGSPNKQTEEILLIECLAKYKNWLLARPTYEKDLSDLWEQIEHGKLPLGCWCITTNTREEAPLKCHTQILASLLEERFRAEGD